MPRVKHEAGLGITARNQPEEYSGDGQYSAGSTAPFIFHANRPEDGHAPGDHYIAGIAPT